jgi:hypothetical protein
MKYATGRDAMTALRDYLQERFNGEHSATFVSYGGADVVLEGDEPGAEEEVGRPYIVLSMGNDEESGFSAPRMQQNDVQILARCVASDFSGAQTGEANPEGSDTKLGRVLAQCIETKANRKELAELGLLRPRFSAAQEIIRDGAGGEYHDNPHTIVLTYEKGF